MCETQQQLSLTLQNQPDDSFNTTMASMSLPSPAATSGWNSSIGSDFGVTPTLSPVSTLFINNPHAPGALPSYDSFDDPLSGSRIHSIRSSSPSDEEHAFGGLAFSHLNVAGSRRSIDFQSQSLRSSASSNFNESSNAICHNSPIRSDSKGFLYPNNDVFDKSNLLGQQSQHIAASLKSCSSSVSIRYNISFSLPAMFNNINR